MPEDEARTASLTLRLTAGEYDVLYRRSVAERTPVSRLARELIFRNPKNTDQELSA
jgi:hypothetical protein